MKPAFSDLLPHDRGTGTRTPKTTLPFRVLGGFSGLKEKMVPLTGESLNTLFQELADWEHQLKALEADIPHEFERDVEEPAP